MTRLFFSMLRPASLPIVITGKVKIISGQPTVETVRLERRKTMSGTGTLLAEVPITGGRYTITLPASFKVDPAMIYALVVTGDCVQATASGTTLLVGQEISLAAGGTYTYDLYAQKLENLTYTIYASVGGDLESGARASIKLSNGQKKMSISMMSPYKFTLMKSEFTDGARLTITIDDGFNMASERRAIVQLFYGTNTYYVNM